MPKIESLIMKNKAEKRILKIQLDEGESLMKAIPQAMREHGVKEAKVEEIKGSLKEILINFFEGNKFDSRKLKDQEVLRVHGMVKQSFGDLYGGIHVSLGQKPPLTGTLVNAIAGKDNEIVLSFIELIPKTE